MKVKALNFTTAITFTALSFFVLFWWLSHNPVTDFRESIPGMDNRPQNLGQPGAPVNFGALFSRDQGAPSSIEGNWSRFRGPDFDNISKEKIKLVDNWKKEPKVIWKVNLGEGHAGPVIYQGKVYLLDYDEKKKADILRCFSLDDGREIWRRGYNIYTKRNHGISRTVPAVSDKYVVTMGPKCQVMCVRSDSGDFLWGKDLAGEYGTQIPLWYTGQCPLIENSTAVIAPGGTSLVIGIDCETGRVLWNTPNPHQWKMSHSSLVPINYRGRKMYIYSAIGGILGISAEKETAGKIMFESTLWTHNVIAPSPVYLGQGRILVTAGYGKGSMLLKISEQKAAYPFGISVLQKIKSSQGLASEQQTPIFYREHLFSILPKDAGPGRNQFVCFSPLDLKKAVWSSGKTRRFGLGPYLVADGKFFILSDDGVLTVVSADTGNYEQLGQVKILQGVDAWGPMAIVQGRLLARDSSSMVCIDLRKGI